VSEELELLVRKYEREMLELQEENDELRARVKYFEELEELQDLEEAGE
jgi:hypothetical protein